MSDSYIPSVEDFDRSVASHNLSVLLDGGVYRHLVFSVNKIGYIGRFEIVTFPGSLVLTGDMGTWVFSRIHDMFQFFRGGDRRINPAYWAEKLQNGVCGGTTDSGCTEYNPITFKRNLIDSLDGYDLKSLGITKNDIVAELDDIDFYAGEACVRDELDGFECGDFQFSEVWEIGSRDWRYHFIWCLRAIVWGIDQYDKERERANE